MLSRDDIVTITSAEWVQDKRTMLWWWTVRTDKTGTEAINIAGVESLERNPHSPYHEETFAVGASMRLGALSGIPAVMACVMAYGRDSEGGVVLAVIGRIEDRWSKRCGPIAYLVPQSKTRDDTVPPTGLQMKTLQAALDTLMLRGSDAAISRIDRSGLFESAFEFNAGYPNYPTKLIEGAFEWKQPSNAKSAASDSDLANRALRIHAERSREVPPTL